MLYDSSESLLRLSSINFCSTKSYPLVKFDCAAASIRLCVFYAFTGNGARATLNPSSKLRSKQAQMEKQCPTCFKFFTNRFTVKGDMQIHTGQFSFYCEVCKKGYVEKSSYLKHLNTIHESIMFPCNRCDKRFKTEAQLKCHMPTHTGQWNFWFEVCRNGFSIKSQFISHQKKHFTCKREHVNRNTFVVRFGTEILHC